jgi:hypothetical protein
MKNPLQKENQYTTRPGGHPTKGDTQPSMRHESSASLILVMIITFIHCMWCKNPGNNRGELKERGKTMGFTCT